MRRELRPSAAEIVGVPFLPPAGVAMAAMRLRSALSRLTRAMAPPPVAILEGLFGLLEHRVLAALCAAQVPDLLTGPQPPADLARRAGVDPDRLERLLRAAALHGWVRFDRRGRVRPTRVTAFLRRDHPGGWRAWVDFAGGPEISSAVALLSAAGPADPFAAASGSPFFEWMAEHPDRWAAFDGAMAAGARMHALALLAALDWRLDERICDVGGGTGHLLAILLDALPSASGTVLDLPGVVARATAHERMTVRQGDMFESVPAGNDTYLLVNVVHDWGDTEVVTILGTIAAVLGQGRLVVVEGDRLRVPRDRLSAGVDVLMAALTGGGRERDRRHVAEMAGRAGLRLAGSTRLASGDLAHELRALRSP